MFGLCVLLWGLCNYVCEPVRCIWCISLVRKVCGINVNPSSPRGGCTNPPNGFRPGAQNRTAKGLNCSGYLQVHPFPSFWRKNSEPTTYTGGRVSLLSKLGGHGGLVRSHDF